MGKEVKIGLAVIFVLLGVFGYALYNRLKAGPKDAAVADNQSVDKEAAKKDSVPKLSSGPSKLSSGPAKLSSGPSKLSSGPSKLSSGAARSTEPARQESNALSQASTPATNARDAAASSDRPAVSAAGGQPVEASSGDAVRGGSSRVGAAVDRYADRYRDYRSSAASALDSAAAKAGQKLDEAATSLEQTAGQLSGDPFSRQSSGSSSTAQTDNTATLLKDVQSAASTAIDDVRTRIDRQAAATVDQATSQFDQGVTDGIDKANTALDKGVARLRQAADSALDKAATAVEQATDAGAAAVDDSNPLRSAATAVDNARQSLEATDAPAAAAASDASARISSRSPRIGRYDLDNHTTTAGGNTTTASDQPGYNSSTLAAEPSASAAGGASASFRSSRSSAATAADRYNLNANASGATGSAATQGDTGASASTPQAGDRYPAAQTTPPRTSDAWSGAGGRTSADTATAPHDARYDRYAAPTANSATASSTPPTTRATPYPASSSPPTTSSTPSRDRSASATTATTATSTASSPPRATITAITPTGKSYTVEPNDNYWVISEKLYGTGSYFKALEYHNRQRYPRGDLLRTGDVIDTPSTEALSASYPALCPKADHVQPSPSTTTVSSPRGAGGRVYVVEEGDTLFDIARYELGKATRWAEIYQLNRQQIGADFNHLRPGTQLILPEDPSTDTFTRRPSAGVQR